MKLEWTRSAQHDLIRLHEFLARLNPTAASKGIDDLVDGARQLLDFPRMGVQLGQYEPLDVRRLFIGDYELRYEVTAALIRILRLWHVREDR